MGIYAMQPINVQAPFPEADVQIEVLQELHLLAMDFGGRAWLSGMIPDIEGCDLLWSCMQNFAEDAHMLSSILLLLTLCHESFSFFPPSFSNPIPLSTHS